MACDLAHTSQEHLLTRMGSGATLDTAMSQQSSKYLRFGIAITVIILALAYLAYTGVQEGKSYYVTVKELHAQDNAKFLNKHLRLVGNVQPGSIHQVGTRHWRSENSAKMACFTLRKSRQSARQSMRLRSSNSSSLRLLNPSRKDTEVRCQFLTHSPYELKMSPRFMAARRQ